MNFFSKEELRIISSKSAPRKEELRPNKVSPSRILVFPTPFYETIMALILFAILWSIRKKLKYGGLLFGIYLIMNGLERFMIEKIRVNTIQDFFGLKLTQAEIISTALVLLGIVLITYAFKAKKPVKLPKNALG